MRLISANAKLLCLLTAVLLGGCATGPDSAPLKPAPAPAPAPTHHPAPARPPTPVPPPAPVLPPDQLALKQGVALYNDGNYNEAIKQLGGAADIWSGGSKAVQLEALKTMAFSYCVTSRSTLCRQQFEKALKLDPGFDLAPGERGHPLWGPVFARAKKGK
ncbi:MAG: TssQ family T6SS-associated lipoprotein [Pseudomonadota bacterium]